MNSEYVEDVTLANLKKTLTQKAKDKDLNFEQQRALEHSKIFSNITPANSEKLKEKLLEIGLSDDLATKITDLLPTEIELNLITEKLKDIDEDKKKEILDIVNKFKK